jgi:hypothetical protein
MTKETLRQRKPVQGTEPIEKEKEKVQEEHPGGDEKYGRGKQILRGLMIFTYFTSSSLS